MNVGVILAIDYGQKRLGLALSDEHGVTARPYATWNRTNRRRDLARLRDLAREHAVRRIVVGLPLHLDGGDSAMSRESRAFALRVERALGIPVEMMDERLSSWEAEQIAGNMKFSHPSRSAGTGSVSKRRTALDHVAAAVILRDFLNRARPAEETRD